MTKRLLAPAVLEQTGANAVLTGAVEPAGSLIAQRLGLPQAVAITSVPLFGVADVPPPYLD